MLWLAVLLLLVFLIAFTTFALTYFLHFFGKKRPLIPSKSYDEAQRKQQPSSLDFLLIKLFANYKNLEQAANLLALIVSNIDAFAARASATALAGRSLDMMYYIWEDDLTGRLLLYEALKAADRGVRVRLLLDDINAYGRDPIYAALDQHENIEIRIFNPAIVRSGRLKRAIEMLFRAFSLTRRMHNKAYIVDGCLAFIGGRNIADAYFDASHTSNFRDLDILLIGDEVSKLEQHFDRYWNSAIVQPIYYFTPKRKAKDLEKWRAKLAQFCQKDFVRIYIDHINAYFPFSKLLRLDRLLFAAQHIEIFCDPPEKALDAHKSDWMIKRLFDKLLQAKHKIQITSPYFVPGHEGVEFLSQLAKKGIEIEILTNSLAATDVALVHSGYMRYRKALLKAGIKIYELKPDCGAKHKFRLLPLRPASLHTKAFLIDQKFAFIGSFNFDARSVAVNTEMGLFFECPNIAAHMDLLFAEETTGEMSYRLSLGKEGDILWSWIGDNVLVTKNCEPHCSFWRRAYVKFLSWLPIESQL